ncbi:MAG: YqgE/AlgH family protein [Acidimicrobiales bacterium]
MVTAGDLLIASPGMHDATFDRTVILLLEHDESGSMGLVLNRPSDISVSDALPDMSGVADPCVLFLGGPVEEGTALVLAEPVDPAAPAMHYMNDGIGLVDLGASVDALTDLIRVRVFSGYAGWGPRQLEGELRTGSWIAATPDPTDMWDPACDMLWARVLRRQGQLGSFLATYPEQPWLN